MSDPSLELPPNEYILAVIREELREERDAVRSVLLSMTTVLDNVARTFVMSSGAADDVARMRADVQELREIVIDRIGR